MPEPGYLVEGFLLLLLLVVPAGEHELLLDPLLQQALPLQATQPDLTTQQFKYLTTSVAVFLRQKEMLLDSTIIYLLEYFNEEFEYNSNLMTITNKYVPFFSINVV